MYQVHKQTLKYIKVGVSKAVFESGSEKLIKNIAAQYQKENQYSQLHLPNGQQHLTEQGGASQLYLTNLSVAKKLFILLTTVANSWLSWATQLLFSCQLTRYSYSTSLGYNKKQLQLAGQLPQLIAIYYSQLVPMLELYYNSNCTAGATLPNKPKVKESLLLHR